MLLVTKVQKDVTVATVDGKVTKKGVQTGTSKAGKNYARVTLTVSASDYAVNNADYNLGVKLKRNGENAKYPMLFVDVVAYDKTAERLAKVNPGERLSVLGLARANEYNGEHSLSVTLGDYTKVFERTEGSAPAATPINDVDGVVDEDEDW